MTFASSYQSKNFTISYFNPLPQGGAYLGDLSVELNSWKHTVSAFGGFDTANFTLTAGEADLADWAANGLFRAIRVTDNSLDTIWEGYVDTISIAQAGLSLTIGPISDIGNRLFAIYSGVDTSVYPPEIGVRKKTPTFNNTKSQSIWGIWHTILSLAGVTDSNADQLVSTYLKEHANPHNTSEFSFNQKELTLSVNCLGWIHSLRYPYNYTVASGTVNLSTRLQEILAAQLNSWVSTDYTRITTNTTQVQRYENDDQLAIEQLRGFTAMGDAADNRYIFGIYENRQAVYEPIIRQKDYEIQLRDPSQRILDSSGAVVMPWKVRPGKWLFFSDFLPGLGAPYADPHEDPRMLQIEKVEFDINAPYAVRFSGAHYSAYEQKLARMGLRGMNV